MPPTITSEQLAGALQLRDLSDPAHGPHSMQLIVKGVTAALETRWRCAVHTYRASPIVTIAENYEVLGYPADAPAREARYTRYLDDHRLLRTHTSAVIPEALRRLAGTGTELVVACPGLVYRRDVVDRLHVGEPHQLDLWRVRRGAALDAADLDEMIDLVVSAAIPGVQHRALPASHPYTRDGREVEVRVDGAWVELLECGLPGRMSWTRRGSTRRDGRVSRSGSGLTGR
jgi:phenylalanyl-tRNA synthetase alpha chain